MDHLQILPAPTAKESAALAAGIATDEDSLAWAALLCRPGSSTDIAAAQAVPVEAARRAETGLRQRSAATTRAHLTALYTVAGVLPGARRPARFQDPRELTWADQVLLRLLARVTVAEAAAELALTPATVQRRLTQLLTRLDAPTLHEATAHAARMHLVRPWDVRPDLPTPAPAVADELRPTVDAITAALARSARVCAQVPRGEQPVVAAAVAHTHAGPGARVLVVVPAGPAWDLAMHEWAAARARAGTAVGLQTSHQLRHAGHVDERWPVAGTARGLLDLTGTRQAVTVVVTPEALPLLTALHRRTGGIGPWDLVVVGDAHQVGHPDAGGRAVHDDQALPAAARLALTSTSPERLPADAGAPVVRRTVADAAAQGRARGHWLLATAPPPPVRPGPLADLAVMILETSRLYGLRRVHVVCGSHAQRRQLTHALRGAETSLPERRRPASLWVRELPPGQDATEQRRILAEFTRGRESVLVLATCTPVVASGTDALLVLDPHRVEAAAEAIEWAVAPPGRDTAHPLVARPLVVLAPFADPADGQAAGQGERFAGIVRAAALLDPALPSLAAQHPLGSPHPWLETGPHLSAGDRQLVEALARGLVRDGA
ncbi:hypothetical protein AB0O91_00015 [Kitasatospora sp. NPDC089797]|uniref:hypothetical protein n=1 Tax=Kitasatospora sp. NPDC089797 TaxID=3155298 RepID=UPI003445ABE1